MTIDCHCHAATQGRLGALFSKYLARAEAVGIAHTVLFPHLSSDYATTNRQVAEIVGRDPQRFSALAFVHPVRDRGRVEAVIREAVEQLGFRGIKVHRRDGLITREICESAAAYGLPILYDIMAEVSVVDRLAVEYPDVNFIIPHLGSFQDDARAQQAMIDRLERYPNIYADTSGVKIFDLLEEAVRRAGPGKLLFGTDSPWLHPGLELAKVRALRLAPEDERLVLSGNCLRLMPPIRPDRSSAHSRIRRASPPGDTRMLSRYGCDRLTARATAPGTARPLAVTGGRDR